MNTSLDVVVGGQFGSEAKGRVAGALAVKYGEQYIRTMGIRVAGPNAGHVVFDQGRRYAMRQIPVAFVNPEARLYIAPGSEVDFDVLKAELNMLEADGYKIRERLLVSSQATIITPAHIRFERNSDLVQRLGSTAKGIGAARADRIWRIAPIVKDAEAYLDGEMGVAVGDHDLNTMFRNNKSGLAVVLEGAQGYGLGLHAGHYPQCTSSDARAIDFLAMAGISPWSLNLFGANDRRFRIHVVVRPNPIRVAGNSGELKGETTWKDLGLPEEHTTVTQKVRRVGEFDVDQVREAVAANGHAHVGIAFSMVDQIIPEVAGFKRWRDVMGLPDDQFAKFQQWQQNMNESIGCEITSLGTGPDSTIWL